MALAKLFLAVSILSSPPLTYPVIKNSKLFILVFAPLPNSESSLVSSCVCTKTAGYCDCANSSKLKGCLVTFLTAGLDILVIVVVM